jgi:hypothetical protein
MRSIIKKAKIYSLALSLAFLSCIFCSSWKSCFAVNAIFTITGDATHYDYEYDDNGGTLTVKSNDPIIITTNGQKTNHRIITNVDDANITIRNVTTEGGISCRGKLTLENVNICEARYSSGSDQLIIKGQLTLINTNIISCTLRMDGTITGRATFNGSILCERDVSIKNSSIIVNISIELYYDHLTLNIENSDVIIHNLNNHTYNAALGVHPDFFHECGNINIINSNVVIKCGSGLPGLGLRDEHIIIKGSKVTATTKSDLGHSVGHIDIIEDSTVETNEGIKGVEKIINSTIRGPIRGITELIGKNNIQTT